MLTDVTPEMVPTQQASNMRRWPAAGLTTQGGENTSYTCAVASTSITSFSPPLLNLPSALTAGRAF